jgi:hypothetical protein
LTVTGTVDWLFRKYKATKTFAPRSHPDYARTMQIVTEAMALFGVGEGEERLMPQPPERVQTALLQPLGRNPRASIVALLQRVTRLADPLRIDGWRAVSPGVTDEGRDGGDLVVGERPAK